MPSPDDPAPRRRFADRRQREQVYDRAARRALRSRTPLRRFFGAAAVAEVSSEIESWIFAFAVLPVVAGILELYVSAKQGGATRIVGLLLGVAGTLWLAVRLRRARLGPRWRFALLVITGTATMFVLALVIALVGGRDV